MTKDDDIERPPEFPFGALPETSPTLPFFPFQNGSMPFLTFFSVLKSIFMLPIFLVRLVLFLLCFLIGYSWTKLVMLGVPANHSRLTSFRYLPSI